MKSLFFHACALLLALPAMAAPIFTPSTITYGGVVNGSNQFITGRITSSLNENGWPSGQEPTEAVDGQIGTGSKYLNLAVTNTALLFSGTTARVANRLELWVAEDAVERDPASYILYGTNTAIPGLISNDFLDYSGFTQIATGTLALPATRDTTANTSGFSQGIAFPNTTAFASYLLVFPTVKNAPTAANAMQISEVQLYESVIIGTDSFDYPDGPIAGKTGGQLWNWRNRIPAARTAGISDWDDTLGAPLVTGGRLITDNSSAQREYNGPQEGLPIDRDEGFGAISAFNDGVVSFVHKTVYYRATFTTGATLPDSLSLISSDFGIDSVAFGLLSGSGNFAIRDIRNANAQTNSTTAVAANTTYTVVAKLDFGTGTASLFVNPDLNAAEPSPTVTRPFSAAFWSSRVKLASGSGGSVAWDDLSIVTLWDDLGTVVTTKDDEDDGVNSLNTPADISLREAVKYSAPGSLITFAAGLNGQTCTLSTGNEIVVTKSLTLDASSLSSGLTIDGGTGTNRLFFVNSGQSLTLRGLTLTGGNGTGASNIFSGGAIYNGGTLTLTQCTLSGNSVGALGGAIFNSSTLTLTQCTLSGNSAFQGGAIFNESLLTLTQCSLSGNSASFQGGAIFSYGTLTLTQCTLSGNSANDGSGGGGAIRSGNILTLSNSIVAGNSAPTSPDVLNQGAGITTTGVNLLSNLAGSTLTAGPSVIVGDPKLSPLGSFGGPVQTMHPLIGSPAIDAAGTTDPGGTDARGFPRFVDGTTNSGAQTNVRLDIGAVEAGPLLTVTATGDAPAALGTLRTVLGSAATQTGARLAFTSGTFPATITLNGTELGIPATANGLFIDASNLSGPVTISGNNASRVFNIVSGATVAMHSVRIVNGKAADGASGPVGGNGFDGASGGGILSAGSLSLFSCTLSENVTGYGSFNVGGNGGSGGSGGGIFSSGSLSLTACTVSGNAAVRGGNGLGNTGGNGGSGGGIFSTGPLSLTACTLFGNATGNGADGLRNGGFGGSGGGIFSSGSLSLTACTIVGNQTGSGGTGKTVTAPSGIGGGISGGNAILENCLIGLNTRGPSTADDVSVSTITYVGGNLLSTAATGTATGSPTINPNPLLAPLGDYGGPTQTRPPLPGSPAIDAAAATTAQTDQRGFPRSRDGDGNGSALPDIGAVEASLIAVTNTNDTGTGSLRQAVLDAAAQPGPDTVYFTAAVTGTITLASEITISDAAPVTIDATGLSGGLTIDGGTGTNRLFYVNSGQSLTLRGLTLTGGNGTGAVGSGFGGAIRNAGTLTLTQCTLSGNSASNNGGAINNTGTLTLTQCTLSANSASSGNGGAITNVGTLTLTQCTLSGNSASNGGAIFSNTDLNTLTATLTHCTLTGNIASSRGGAFYNEDGRTTLVHCTITGNTAPAGQGSGVASFGDGLTETVVKNTLISGNGGSSVDLVGSTTINSFTSQGGNLIGSGNATGDFNQPGDVINDTPKLSPLGYFGGPVQTMHPLIGSPAIDAIVTSDPGGTDARGFPRFVDGDAASAGAQLDIGAVEAGPLLTVTVTGDVAAAPGTLRTVLASAATQTGARLAFTSGTFPATITLNGTELGIPATANGLFIDASNLTGPVTVSGNNASRVFNIVSGATVAMHSVRIVNGKAPDGANGVSSPFFGSDGGNGGGGGGILTAGSLSLFSCTVQNNRAGRGGNGGTSGPVFNGNGGDGGDGGGIASSGALNLTACTIDGNSSGDGGSKGSVTGESQSGGTGGGGGVFSSGSLSLTACTLSGNSTSLADSGGDGGGIFSSGSLRLTASTLAGNVCTIDKLGGGIFATAAILEDCIIGLNTRFNGTPADVNVTNITYVGGNLLGTAATVTGAATGAPTFVETPSIRDLGDYGGPTQTVALQPSSRARNAGTATARSTDQRGFPIVGAPDLGAFEAQIGAIANVTLVEGATLPTRTFPVGQIGALTATSSNPTLVPVGNIVITGSGASRSVTVTPAAGQFGVCTITLTENLRGEQQTFQFEMQTNNAFLVTNANDSGAGSLRNALSLAASTVGIDTISFAVSVNGSITLTSEISVNDTEPVLVDASALAGGLVLNAGPNSRHFQVAAGASLTLRGITLQNGNASGDGGSLLSLGTLILERCLLTNNQSTGHGGAVEARGLLFRAVDCTLANNTAGASSEGGGIRSGAETTELTRCTLSGNSGTGMVLRNDTSAITATLSQCTLANNQGGSSSNVGGLAIYNGTANLIHCTISGNSASNGGGGITMTPSATLNLTQSIIAGNTATGGFPADLSSHPARIKAQGANLIGSNQSVEALFPAGPLVGTATAPRDPMLESFNSYGGLTFTMPPRVGSPALDQAAVLSPALTTDQRGLPRPLGIRPDLGAVEASIIVVTTPVDELDPPGSPGNGVSLREAVRDVPAGGAIDFDRAIFGGATAYVLTLTQGPLNPPRNGFLFNTANPNGLRIQYAATITQQPQSVALGANATFSVGVVNLSGGVAYQWRKNGSPEATTASLSISNAQESNEGVYDVVLSEVPSVGSIVPAGSNFTIFPVSITPFSGVSQPASLVVNGAAVTITRSPSSAMLALGSNHTLSVVAVGPPRSALAYQWFKAGKAISGATKSSYTITNAQLTHAGAYTCVVKSSAASATSNTAEIGVVDTRPKTVNLKVGGSFTAKLSAAGNGLLIVMWRRDATQVVSSGTTIPINPVSSGDAGLYTCEVRGPGGTIIGCNTRLNISTAPPALLTPVTLPPAFIGQTYFHQLAVIAGPVSTFSMTGTLPTGMSFNTTTGVLSGRPTVTRTGGYALSFKATNPSGTSPAAATTLKVNVVPPTAVGTFAGPMARSSLFNGNLGGRFDLTTSGNGLCSGGITLGARTKISFKNQLLLSAGTGDVILRANIPGVTLADRTPLTAYIEVFAADQRAVLTLVHPTLGTTLITPAWRNPWLLSKTPSLNNPATPFAAKYNLRLDAGVGGTVSPSGYGYASFTVSTAGALTLAGKLPDGSAVSGGSFVSKDGEIALFNLLYATTNRGSHVGQFVITPNTPVTDNTVSGTTTWFKPAPLASSTDTVYKSGFGPLTVTAVGAPYLAPAKGAIVPGFIAVGAGSTNAKLNFTLGNLDVEAKEFTQLLRIYNPSATGLTNAVTIATPISNTTTMTTFTASSGQFVGSFTINGATTTLNRPAPFYGQLVKIGATTQGYGFFLLPTATAKISTSPKLSGRVVLGLP